MGRQEKEIALAIVKEFDPHGWEYGSTNPVDALLQMSDPMPALKEHAAGVALQAGGGKAFGLFLCEWIASKDERLTVPQWTYVESPEQGDIALGFLQPERVLERLGGKPTALIVRSSGWSEDWKSGAAGEAESLCCQSGELLMAFSRSWERGGPVVVQEAVDGIGIVVDIAWSERLQQPIVRTATGRENTAFGKVRNRFTSATWDNEGLFDLFDQDNRRLVQQHSGQILLPSVAKIPVREIARVLFRIMRSSGWKFGVQLELVVHPECPNRWHLVQLRPSPSQVRGFTTSSRDFESVIETTPVVFGAYDVTARLEGIRKMDENIVLQIAEELRPLDRDLERLRGSIVLWDCQPHDDYWLTEAVGLTKHGIVGHITKGAMLVNTSHSRTEKPAIREGTGRQIILWRQALKETHVIGVSTTAFDLLAKYTHHGGATVRIVSDGLVGQVYVVG